MTMGRSLRILAVDDSAVMRGFLRAMFAALRAAPGCVQVELCGTAADGVECLEAVERLQPDVLLLDLEMPRMHGLDVLDRLQKQRPGLPIIMCSAYTATGAMSTLDALARGAADYVTKPSGQKDFAAAVAALTEQLLPKILALANRKPCAESVALARSAVAHKAVDAEVVVVGVSTGGPSALEKMLPRLPARFPAPVLIVQHMPKLFTGALAERLDRCCALRVREAFDGAKILPGTVWIAPGDAHMEIALAAGSGDAVVALHQREPLQHCKPAVDYLFASAAQIYKERTLALVMTGMGSDGLAGARKIYEAGGTVLAQDAATSAVWGMPGRVTEAGIAAATLPLDELADELIRRTGGRLTDSLLPPMRTEETRGRSASRERRRAAYGVY